MSVAKIDALYLAGKGQEDSFAFYYANLRPLLWKYARAIGHQNQNHIDDHLIDEMVDDLLMDIGAFQGKSKFSTWAYIRFKRGCIAEYRFVRKNIGDSLEMLQDNFRETLGGENGITLEYVTDPYEKAEDPAQECQVIVGEFKSTLSERQLIVLDGRLEGFTFEEIGETLDVTAGRAHQIWKQTMELAKEYGEVG